MIEKISYTNKFGSTFTVEAQCDDTIFAIVDELIKPLLLAAGFHPKSVAEAFGEEEEELNDGSREDQAG